MGSDFSQPVIVAGGGGGGGGLYKDQGGSAGDPGGGSGSPPDGGGGGAGSLTEAGGGGRAVYRGEAGSQGSRFTVSGPGVGGAGGSDENEEGGGGGGGGGYFGGGGGGGGGNGAGGGGGGGSSLVPAGGSVEDTSESPQVQITYGAAPEPPTDVTDAASIVTSTSSTLNGSVNPNGQRTHECQFEYGPTISYGTTVPCSELPGAGETPTDVSAVITALTVNAEYHYRVVAKNATGTTYGSDETFSTLPYPPTVATAASSTVTQSSATFDGVVNPNGGTVNNCHFEYGATTSYGSSASCAALPGSGESPVAVSASVSGLSANTTYHFRIVATNSGGISQGSDQSFTTLPNPPSGSPGDSPSGGSSGGAASGGSTSGGVGTGSISSARIEALLAGELNPSGKAAKIATLLKGGAFNCVFDAPEAGTFLIDWYQVPAGAKLAKKTKPKPVLVAAGQGTFSAAGSATIKIKLTAAGKRLLKHTKQLKVTAKSTFTPAGSAAITVTRVFVLKR